MGAKSRFVCLLFLWASTLSAKSFKSTEIDSGIGRKILKILRQSDQEQDTTSYRKEFKSVIDHSLTEKLLHELAQKKVGNAWFRYHKVNPKKIDVSRRDEVTDGVINKTFTIYGRNLFFMNLGAKTKLKLRVRFYIEQLQDGTLQRSRTLSDQGFLEIKVKNPSLEHLSVTEKYRVKLPDAKLREFYLLSQKQNYQESITSFFESLKDPTGHKNKNRKLEGLRHAISILAKIEPEFAKPKFATFYERASYKYVEKVYYKNHLFRKPFAKDVEYQVTIDSHVVGMIPNEEFKRELDFNKYIQVFEKDIVFRYPSEANAIEVKIPSNICSIPAKQRSTVHRLFHQVLIDPILLKENIFPGFTVSRGKAGHFLNHVLENKISGVFDFTLPVKERDQCILKK